MERLAIDVYDGNGDVQDVAMWCMELRLWGQGPDYVAAQEDLVNDILVYADDYFADLKTYQGDRTRRDHAPILRRAQQLGPAGIARELLGPYRLRADHESDE